MGIMNDKSPLLQQVHGDNSRRFKINFGIGTKIILPYLLLTIVVAGIGAFIISNLVTSSLQERFHNQLLDAGRLVSESMVQYEEDRLQVLRAVAGTVGVPDALADADSDLLAQIVPQIIINSSSHAVKLLNMEGIEVYGWRQLPNEEDDTPIESAGEDFSDNQEIRRILAGEKDQFGDKRVLLLETNGIPVLYTAGPVFLGDRQIGVVMVGQELRQMVMDLTLAAVARVTLYDKTGRVLDTTLGGSQDSTELAQTFATLHESSERYEEVREIAPFETPLQKVTLLEQEYLLAFSDWRLRGQSFGMFSVALSSNFIPAALATSRTLFSLVFAGATIAVLAVGFMTAQQIIKPVDKLVQTALAVSAGDLDERSGIKSQDEIGKLAQTFDYMTAALAERNRELMEQASKLEAVLNSIVDGVIVLDMDDQFISTNDAAQKLLADMSYDFMSGPLRELGTPGIKGGSAKQDSTATSFYPEAQPKRYQIGNRVLSTLAAPVNTPEGEQVGTVIIMRDITSEAEADQLKDAFITSISHELRTPLTVIKVYTDLILKTANGHMDERHVSFLQKISKNSEHLEQHINQLINISEIQAGTFNIEKKRVDFVSLVRTVAENWRERLSSKSLELGLHLPDEPLWIDADANQLSWAVEVLLSNAHNYTQKGGVDVCVFREGNEARLDIVDTGIGIAAADQPHLFERFFRAANAVNFNVRGVGLGLYISRSIVELHNGRIWLKSESGAGSTFSWALPLVE
ncbi:MAG: ATP-binding protein [Anaerolineae bacterium]